MEDFNEDMIKGAIWMSKYFCKEHSDSLSWREEGSEIYRYNEVDFEDKYNCIVYLERILEAQGVVPPRFIEELFDESVVSGYDSHCNRDLEGK